MSRPPIMAPGSPSEGKPMAWRRLAPNSPMRKESSGVASLTLSRTTPRRCGRVEAICDVEMALDV